MKRRKKQGSATFLVIMVMTVILILSFSLVPLTFSSINQSSTMYRRNKGFYGAEGSLEKVLYHIDAYSERARKKVNEECFDMKNKVPNMDNIYIAKIYQMHSNAITSINAMPIDDSQKQALKETENKVLEDRIKSFYMYSYNLYIQDFFTSQNSSQVKSKLALKENLIKESGESFYTWSELKSQIETSKDNDNQKIVLIEGLHRIKDGSPYNQGDQFKKEKTEFDRFIPKGNESYVGEFTTFKEISKLLTKENNPTDQALENDIKTNIATNSIPFKETFYVKTLDDKDTTKYAAITIEMDPLKESEIKTENIEGTLYTSVLDYGIISGKNLAVGNNLTVNSDVIVNGQGVPDTDLTKEVRYGGIIAGHEQNLLTDILNVKGISAGSKGNVTINGNAYVGSNEGSEALPDFQGGFLQTVTDDSLINIKNNVFCHSVMVGKNVKGPLLKDSINIGESAFVADNVTLEGSNASVNIGKNIIGFEDGAKTNNAQYLASPSIVINKYDEDITANNSSLKVGGQVTLLGEVFAESWFRTMGNNESNPGKKVLYKTFQTVGLYDNIYAFTEKFHPVFGPYTDKVYSDDMYSTYTMLNDETYPLDFLDKYKATSNVGSTFILDYINNAPVIGDGVVNGYDLGKGWLSVPNININSEIDTNMFEYINGLNNFVLPQKGKEIDIQSNNGKTPIGVNEYANRLNGNGGSGLNISYFNSFFIQDGKIYVNNVAQNTSDKDYVYEANLIESVNTKLGGTDNNRRVIKPGSSYNYVEIRGKLNAQVFDPLKLTLSRRLGLQDVVTYSVLEQNGFSDYKSKKGLSRCFNWDGLKNEGIFYNEPDKYIHISKGDIVIPPNVSLAGKDVLIVSGSDVIIDAASSISLKGNILAKGNIVTKGSSIEITPDKAVSTKLINHNSDKALGDFFRVSSIGDASNTTIETITKQNKTNLSIISRNELLN